MTTMNAVMNLFLLCMGMIPMGHYAFAPSYYFSYPSIGSTITTSRTRLYYNNHNNTDNGHDTVGSDGERYVDGEKEKLQAERERLLSLFASPSSSAPPLSSSSPKDKEKKKNLYFASAFKKSSSTGEAKEQTKKEGKIKKTGDSKDDGSIQTPTTPLKQKLTTMARKSLEMEMKLLESLKDSDDAQVELWHFWYNHRGYNKMTYLYGAGQMCQHPNQWDEAELILRELIRKESDELGSSSSSASSDVLSSLNKSFKKRNNGNDCSSSSSSSSKPGKVKNESSSFQSKAKKDDMKAKDIGQGCNCDEEDDDASAFYSGCYGWLEPVNRLATLMFYQGRLEEAKELCEFVLKYKPWHFGCQTGIVTVCQHLNDTEGIEYWSSKRMPPLEDGATATKPIKGFSSEVNSNSKKTNNPTPREVWVNNMLQEAQCMLDFNGYDEDEDDFQDTEDDTGFLRDRKQGGEEDDDDDAKQNVWE